MKILKFLESQEENLLNDFVDKIKSDCEKSKIKFILVNETHVPCPPSGVLVNGYFIQYPYPTLACATKKPIEDWVGILTHESSHMDQYIENTPEWRNSFIGKKETCEFTDEWINGKEFPSDEIDFFIRSTMNVELDCEKRTAEKIEKYNLPININDYIRGANSYVLFHLIIKKYRKWYIPGREPYRTKQILNLMSTKFDMNYQKLTKELEDAFLKYCLE